MKLAAILEAIEFKDDRPNVNVLFETQFTKELRITLKSGVLMKEHQTPFPIVVQVVKGKIDFGVAGEAHHFSEGNMIALEGNVPHDLKAHEDSIIRLTLSKGDSKKRVDNI